MAKISIPFNLENTIKTTKLTEKEIKAKEHLEEMAEITRSLGYNDIQLLNKRKEKAEKAEQQQQEKEIEEKEEIEKEKTN